MDALPVWNNGDLSLWNDWRNRSVPYVHACVHSETPDTLLRIVDCFVILEAHVQTIYVTQITVHPSREHHLRSLLAERLGRNYEPLWGATIAVDPSVAPTNIKLSGTNGPMRREITTSWEVRRAHIAEKS